MEFFNEPQTDTDSEHCRASNKNNDVTHQLSAIDKSKNGISKEDVADYMDGYVDKFASEMMAALGRMEVEKKELEKENDTITKSAVHYILLFMDAMLSDPEMQKAIMEKGKSPRKLLEKMKNTAKKHAEGNTGVCCGTDKELKDLIKIYYTQSEDELKKKM